jgi:hypothetical protein
MSQLGTNLKLTIAADNRPRTHALFVDVLGATALQPNPNLEVYRLADGGNIGVFYVAPSEALGAEDQKKGAWLEFAVADPAETGRELEATGVTRIEYFDKSHAYFQMPGGPVFRLASASR